MKKELININKIKNDSNKLRKETGEKISFYILSAFSLVVALSWNDTIQTIINLIPVTKNTIIAKVVYSIFITITLVFISLMFNKINKKDEK